MFAVMLLGISMIELYSAGDNDLLNKEVSQSSKIDKKFISNSFLNVVSDKNFEEIENCDNGNVENITEDDFYGLPPPDIDISDIIDATLAITDRKPSKVEEEIDSYMERLSDLFKITVKRPKSKLGKHLIDLDPTLVNELFTPLTGEHLIKTDVKKAMSTSNIPLGLEKLKELPNLSRNQQRKLNRIERAKTKGANWFNMPAPEITEEIQNDLKILQMRSALDPKHFYKKNDLKVLPKYFQIGTVQHSPLDYYNERNTRKNKKRSIVDELLADNEAQQYTKRKYKEIMEQKQKYAHRKNMKKMKKLKKHK